MPCSPLCSRLKPYLRWGILAATLIFLGQTLSIHWQQVQTIRLARGSGGLLLMALGVTLLAHSWAGWVWGWILQALQQPIPQRWSTVVYLQTNLWKYLPGNVWHFLGRVRILQQRGVPSGPAVVGVLMEPVLMAVAALILGLATPTPYWWLQVVGIGLGLGMVHPRWINPLLSRLGRGKIHASDPTILLPAEQTWLTAYPLWPLAGEVGFVGLRGLGFMLTLLALTPLSRSDLLPLISLFSLAWLMGLLVPGAPGGLGVFEAVAVALIQPWLPVEVVLGGVGLYRLISTIAEILGATLATLDARLNPPVSLDRPDRSNFSDPPSPPRSPGSVE